MLEIIILIPFIIIVLIFFGWWRRFLWKVFNWDEYRFTVEENKRIEEHNVEAAKHNGKLFFEMQKMLNDPLVSKYEKDKIRKEIARYLDSQSEEY